MPCQVERSPEKAVRHWLTRDFATEVQIHCRPSITAANLDCRVPARGVPAGLGADKSYGSADFRHGLRRMRIQLRYLAGNGPISDIGRNVLQRSMRPINPAGRRKAESAPEVSKNTRREALRNGNLRHGVLMEKIDEFRKAAVADWWTAKSARPE